MEDNSAHNCQAAGEISRQKRTCTTMEAEEVKTIGELYGRQDESTTEDGSAANCH